MAYPLRDRQQHDDRSIGDLVGDVSSSVQQLIKREVELAKLETKDQVSKATKAGAMFGATGVSAFVGLLALAMAAGFGLAEVLAPGVAFLIVGVLFFVVAGLLFAQAKRKLANFKPVPEQTLRTIKKDVEVAKDSFAAGASSPPKGRTEPAWTYWNKEDGR